MRIPFSRASSYPLRSGNSVQPLIDGIPAFRAIVGAIDRATRSIWVTVAFLDEGFAFPDARGSLFELLEGAAARGIDVRVLFWSEPSIGEMIADSAHFPAGAASFEVMAAHAPHVLARWDRLRGYCHHQKSWIIDAGTSGEVAFVGGINLDHDSIVSPGHPHGEGRNGGTIHDVYASVRGPSATDVHHNFVQRWNEASERNLSFGVFPSIARAGDMDFPSRVSGEAGASLVQVARTVRAEVYRRDFAAPGASAFPIAGGEQSIREQYFAAIDAAERTIYLENQILLCPELFHHLNAALGRGVDVVAIVPGKTMPEIANARRHPGAAIVFGMLESLGRHDNFLMAGLAATRDSGVDADIYVHAKVAVIDDEWATIGSANAMFRSFRDDTELNITAWDRDLASALRRDLLAEHMAGAAVRADGDDDRRSLGLLRECARDNSERRREGRAMRGNVFAIDPRQWAVPEN